MKTKITLITIVSLLIFGSCKDPKVPNGYIEYQGKNYKEPKTVGYDANGDGVISANEEIGVLGTNLDVTETPDGKSLYKPDPSLIDTSSQNQTLVPYGEKLCYLDVQKYCDTYGGLYAYETTVNGSVESMAQASKTQQIDEDEDGVLDYIQDIRDAQISILMSAYTNAAAVKAEGLLEDASSKRVSAFIIDQYIQAAIQTTLIATLYKNDDFVDIENINQELSVSIAQAIIDIATESGLTDIPTAKLEEIAFTVSNELAELISNDLSETVAKAIIEQHNITSLSSSSKAFQGICPDGYHIPSDAEWMVFELALGMPVQDLTKSGETVTDRGGNENVVYKMIHEHSFDYGGYVSVNGTYAQLGEAGVYWSSSVGEDSKGSYVWVRQIDTSYTGVIRYKHYKKSGLSIRCFKD